MSSTKLKQRTKPKLEPLTLEEVKRFLKLDASDEDLLLQDLIVAVREMAEQYMRQSLLTQVWTYTALDHLPQKVNLPFGPVQTIVSVKLFKLGVPGTTISNSHYYLGDGTNQLHFHFSLLAQKITIEYVAGFGRPADVPATIRLGMLTHLAYLYDNRGVGYSLPPAILSFYSPYRQMEL
jgi:uncharacterized phiE125 gp8 family phage protein